MSQSERYDAIVIGSGFGGLSAAIRLQSAGLKTLILEKRDLPGGRAYVYQDQGFKFDAGPTVITAPHCLEELFDLSGRKMSDYVTLLDVKPFYRLYWQDGSSFDYTQSIDETVQEIRKFEKSDVEGYLRFLEFSKEVFDEGYTKLAHVPFQNLWSMIRVAPQLMRLQAYKSVYSVVSKFVKNEKLREAFSFHSLLVGGNPFSTSAIYTLIHFLERNWGVTFPKGGTGALVSGMVKLFEDLGGTIRLNAEVDEIETQHSSVRAVRLKTGERFESARVVSNADVFRTYKHLLKKDVAGQKKAQKVERMSFSMSLFLIYFGTNRQYPNLAHHNVIFGPRYRELLDDIFKKGVLAEDFSLYLHAPTRTDPSMAPDGCEAFYVLSPVPHLGKSEVDWSVEGPRYADRILSALESQWVPDLRKHIVTQRIFTPVDFDRELNSHHGAAFSVEPILTQSAAFRIRNRDDAIQGLYFVGAGTHPGAGIPGVVNSGKATAALVLEDFVASRKRGAFSEHESRAH